MEKKLSLLAILLQGFYLLLVAFPFLASFIYLLFHWWIFSFPSSEFMINLKFNGAYAALRIANFYIFYLVLFPQFIKSQRLRQFVLFSLLITLVSAGLGALMIKFIPFVGVIKISFGVMLANVLLGIIINPVVPCGIISITSWFIERYQRQNLEKTNLETNLALLKAQINPHFLFNTLNNIDVLIEKDAAAASVYLKKLSDILRFTLYESPSETVALSEEIKYIGQYIDLQKIRTSNTDFVSFAVEGSTDNLRIPPMLFISFIENAFKHCTDKKINNAIEIDIAIGDGEVHFTCSNAFDQAAQLTQPKSGLGLDLIRNRLELLYKQNYQLKIDKTEERFTVTLTVKLHDN